MNIQTPSSTLYAQLLQNPDALKMRCSDEQTVQSCEIAFHEKAGRSQVGSFIFLVGQSSSTESPLSPPFHPQSLMSILLAASWVFSFQPVLPPVSRPLFVVNDEAGQAIDAVTGTRRLELCLSFLRMLLFTLRPALRSGCSCCYATVRTLLHSPTSDAARPPAFSPWQ